jgi:hypothetical protein
MLHGEVCGPDELSAQIEPWLAQKNGARPGQCTAPQPPGQGNASYRSHPVRVVDADGSRCRLFHEEARTMERSPVSQRGVSVTLRISHRPSVRTS